MNNLLPLTVVFLVIGVTWSFVEQNVVWGIGFFVLAMLNEIVRMAIAAAESETKPPDDEFSN